MWTIIAWVVVGGIAGWIASKIMGTDASMGIGANILVGIVGAFLFGLVTALIPGVEFEMGSDAFSIWSFVASLIGACLLLWIVGKVVGRR